MSTEEDEYAQSVFENRQSEIRACFFCAGLHDQVAGLPEYEQPCPRIKRIVRSSEGSLLELEFWPNGAWESRVVFPSDVYEEAL